MSYSLASFVAGNVIMQAVVSNCTPKKGTCWVGGNKFVSADGKSQVHQEVKRRIIGQFAPLKWIPNDQKIIKVNYDFSEPSPWPSYSAQTA